MATMLNNTVRYSSTENNYEMTHDTLEFEGTFECQITDNESIGKNINKLFKGVFKDYRGVTVRTQNVGNGYATVPYLVFDVLNKNEYNDSDLFGFKPYGTNTTNSGDLGERLIHVNGAMNSSNGNVRVKADITDAAKQLLFKYMVGRNNTTWDKFNWPRVYDVIYDRTSTSLIRLGGLDINALLKDLYDEPGIKHAYQVAPAKPKNAVMNPTYHASDNWICIIQRIDEALLREDANRCGFDLRQFGSNSNPAIDGIITD